MDGLVVGLVLSAHKHPDADKLSLTSVDIGLGEPLPIVCGAPNVAAGQKVVVATVGTKLFPSVGEPFVIKKSKIRGELSMGMICAADEIGIGTDHSGILVLPEDTPVGMAAQDFFGNDNDLIFEIGLTPNRSDAACHIGVAKDLYAALVIRKGYTGCVQMPLCEPFLTTNELPPIRVEVIDTDACPRYTGISIKGITVDESPDWLKKRLHSIGVRPINNVVDATNYVLHETGQPLHAFDRARIGGQKIKVQTLPSDTPFVGLDSQKRILHAEDLMICDGNDVPMCMGGIFGGLNSGVSEQTTDLFLESAYFSAVRVRRSSQRHGLHTESAQRFEKGADPNAQLFALKRAALLIVELAGGSIASDIIDVFGDTKVAEKKQVFLTTRNLRRIIGTDISPDELRLILSLLEIDVLSETDLPQGKGYLLAVPTNKADVTREADLIEEVLRIYGINRISEPTVFNTIASPSNKNDVQHLLHTAADFLAANGFLEIMGTSIENSKYYAEHTEGLVHLLGSLNSGMDVLRQNLLFSGLRTIAFNQNHKNPDLCLFESGKTYHTPTSEKYDEQEHFALFMTGYSASEDWSNPRPAKYTFFDLKKHLYRLLQRLGLGDLCSEYIENHPHLSYGLQVFSRKKLLATFGEVRRSELKAFGIKNEVFYADILWQNLSEVGKNSKTTFAEIARYPIVRRDLALVLDKSIRYAQITETAMRTLKNLLKDINLLDVFEDESKVGIGKKSYAISIWLQDETKTLTDVETDKYIQSLLHSLERQFGAVLRQ